MSELTPGDLRLVRYAALNDLIDHQILRVKTKANAEDVQVGEEEIDAEVARFASRFASEDERLAAMRPRESAAKRNCVSASPHASSRKNTSPHGSSRRPPSTRSRRATWYRRTPGANDPPGADPRPPRVHRHPGTRPGRGPQDPRQGARSAAEGRGEIRRARRRTQRGRAKQDIRRRTRLVLARAPRRPTSPPPSSPCPTRPPRCCAPSSAGTSPRCSSAKPPHRSPSSRPGTPSSPPSNPSTANRPSENSATTCARSNAGNIHIFRDVIDAL